MAMATLKVLHQIQVSPSLPSQPPQTLSFLDKIWLRKNQPVERLFFFNFPDHPIPHFLNNILPIFTKSLSLTLHHFYPLAGSIRPSPDSDAAYEIVYTENDAVTLTVAQLTGEPFRDISSHHPRKLETLRLLVPKLPDPSSVCSIQITLFPLEGLCIGLAINHAACDGSSSMQFIRSWANTCRSAEPTLDDIPPPLLDRSIVVDAFHIERKITELALQHKQTSEERSENPDKKDRDFDPSLVHATFTLPKDQILRLKERVGEKSPHNSTFVVTCGYVWSCLLKAKEERLKEFFMFVVDWRGRMRPTIPSNYFGNCLGVCVAELGAGENEVEMAAIAIAKSVHGLEGKDVGEAILEVTDKAMKDGMGKPLSVAGSPKLRVYEIDFGWGRPVKVDVVSIWETEAISLAESGEEEGGIEIGLVLSEEKMGKFVKCFEGGLLDI